MHRSGGGGGGSKQKNWGVKYGEKKSVCLCHPPESERDFITLMNIKETALIKALDKYVQMAFM